VNNPAGAGSCGTGSEVGDQAFFLKKCNRLTTEGKGISRRTPTVSDRKMAAGREGKVKLDLATVCI